METQNLLCHKRGLSGCDFSYILPADWNLLEAFQKPEAGQLCRLSSLASGAGFGALAIPV
jgi:hypothetical protein